MKHLNFTKLKTSTGVPLYVMPLPHSGTVAAGFLVLAGTRDENWPKEAGIAHALEHMHFQGTQELPNSEAVSGYIEEVGGMINAWTWKEMTFYHNQMPVEHKERAVKILSQQLRESTFPEEKIPIEMKNIVQEIRRRNDDPKSYLAYLTDQFLYGVHPLGKDTLGLEESLLKLQRQDFFDFKKRYYHSGNYVFIAAGNIEPAEAQQLFEKYFPEPTNLKANKRELVALTPTTEPGKKNFRKELEQVHLYLAASAPSGKEKASKVLELFTTMVSGGMSFPLFQEVRDKRGLCYEVRASSVGMSDVGEFDIYIGTDPKRYQEAIKASLEVIEKSKNNVALLNKAKNLELGRLALKYESTDNIINIAAQDIALTGEPRGYDELARDIESVSIADVEKVVDQYLKPKQIKTVLLMPEQA